MNYEQLIQDAAETLKAAASALAPAALGSAVAVAMKRGLTWTERTVQFAVGICVSWYVRLAVEAMVTVDPFVAQAIAFTIGLLAYDALPRFRERAILLVGDIPDLIRDWVARRKGPVE